MLNGLMSPCVIAPPSLLSAIWFPPKESTRATAFAVLANNVGNALAFVLVPYVVANWGGIRTVFYAQAIASFSLVFALFYFPAHPPSPPSAAACSLALAINPDQHFYDADVFGKYSKKSQGNGYSDELMTLGLHPSFSLLCLIYSWSSVWPCCPNASCSKSPVQGKCWASAPAHSHLCT